MNIILFYEKWRKKKRKIKRNKKNLQAKKITCFCFKLKGFKFHGQKSPTPALE